MPRTLSQADIDLLEQHVNAGDRIAYYTQLNDWGYRYGGLALQVVLNDGLSGRVANEFFDINAREQGRTVTSQQLGEVSDALFRADFNLRSRQGSASRRGLEESVLDIQEYHEDAFEDFARVGIGAWTPAFLLDAIRSRGEDAGESEERIVKLQEDFWDRLLGSLVSAFAATGVQSILAEIDAIFGPIRHGDVVEYELDLLQALTPSSSSNSFGGYNIVNAIGGRVIGGNHLGNTLTGGFGNDVLIGFDGNDVLNGGGGNDRLYDGRGDDSYDGGSGVDTLYFTAVSSPPVNLTINSGLSGDVITFDMIFNIFSLTGISRDTFDNIEGFTLSQRGDTLILNDIASDLFLDGEGGFDTLRLGENLSDAMINVGRVTFDGIEYDGTITRGEHTVYYRDFEDGRLGRRRFTILPSIRLPEKESEEGDEEGGEETISSGVFINIINIFGRILEQVITPETVDFTEVFGEQGVADAFNSAALETALGNSPIGSVSSLLAAEFVDATGLNGGSSNLFGQFSNEVIANRGEGISSRTAAGFVNIVNRLSFGGTEGSSLNLSARLGARLGDSVVMPRTQLASALGDIGGNFLGASGRVTGTVICGPICGEIGSFIGNFLGNTIGNFLGNLFGRRRPRVPQAEASLILNFNDGTYGLGAVTSRNNGNVDFVSDIAQTAGNSINGFVDFVMDGDPTSRIISGGNTSITFGHGGPNASQVNDVFVRINGRRHLVDSFTEAVDLASLNVIRQTQIAGGNIFLKRAVNASNADSFLDFATDLQIAQDYSLYRGQQGVINQAIADAAVSPSSVSSFAAGWIITLQRAAELGLNESAASDFYGGAQGFVDSLQGIVDAPLDYDDVLFHIRGSNLEVYRDDDGNGSAHSFFDTLIFNETNFLRPIGSAGGGVGYNRATSNANLTQGNDIITNAAGTIDDLTSQYIEIETPRGPIGPFLRTVEGGDDIIVGNSGVNTFYGRSGNDWLDGGGGDDKLYGGEDNDVLLGRAGNDFLYGENGDDVLVAGTGRDDLRGGNGNDVAYSAATTGGWANYSIFRGGAGDDTFYVRGESNTVLRTYFSGGSGNDLYSFRDYGQAINLTLAEVRKWQWQGNDAFFFEADVESVEGTAFSDTITGNSKDNTLVGGAGDDVLNGGGGDDTLEGGAGADHLIRSAPGNVTVSYEHSQGGVDVSIQTLDSLGGGHAFGGDASGDRFTGTFLSLQGSAFADVLEGNHGNNTLRGLDGDDYFITSRANDHIHGGEGFDTADFGNHTGASGLAINAFNGGTTFGYLNGVHGAFGATRLYDIEHIVGTRGNDTIRFGAGDNVLEGGAGNDTLYGGAGNDIYFVELGGGSDRIYEYGNQGHDTIQVGYEEGLSWDDVFIGTPPARGGGANFEVRVQGQLLATALNSANANRELVGVDALDIGGSGAIDIWYLTGASFTTGNILRGYGDRRGFSLLQGGAGNDTIYSASNRSGGATYETNDNILHGGRGNDVIFASVGDDQYIFDRGSGRDTVRDTGGLDHIQFGPGVAVDDIIFEVVGNDLYIGIAPSGAGDTSDLRASRQNDYIRVTNAVTQTFGRGPGGPRRFGANLIEFITVDNTNIDIRTLDIDLGGRGSGPSVSSPPIPAPRPPVSTPTPPPTSRPPIINRPPARRPGRPTFAHRSNLAVTDTATGFEPAANFIVPIVFDLDGDGLELVSIDESRVVIRGENRDLTRLGWVGADDGFLALDRNGDGQINQLGEISFLGDYDGAATDIEGLRGFDTNEDGVFDAGDARFGEFRIWRDLNQNGRSSRRELQSLEQAGISSISLDIETTGRNVEDFADNIATHTAEFTRVDGTTGTSYDVALASTLIREGRESNNSDIKTYEGDLTNRLGRISRRRLETLLARQERQALNDSGTVTPIVLDLNGDGELALTHLSTSGVEIDVNNDGQRDAIGWVGAVDGLLGLDRNGDGTITAVEEISFVEDLAGAQTDLEGLAAFDTDGSGFLDAGDARFADFRVWQDANQDGISQAGELRSLEEAGLLSINLTAHTGRITSNEDEYLDNVVFGHTEVLWADGRTAIAGDVGLRTQYRGGFAQGDDLSPRYITGFAGLENITFAAAERFEQIINQSAWGRAVGRHSPLMARLLAAEAEQARLDGLGTDLEASQDDLLAEFERGFNDNEAIGDSGVTRSVASGPSKVQPNFYQDNAVLNQSGYVDDALYDDKIASVNNGYDGIGAIAQSLTVANRGQGESVAESLDVSNQNAAQLDQFSQAMASFGGTSAFDGLSPRTADIDRQQDIFSQSHRLEHNQLSFA